MHMQADPVNLLAPTTNVMLSTLVVFLLVLALGVYLVVRVWRAVGARTRVAAPSVGDSAQQQQMDELTSRVQELEEAQRFVEQLVERRVK
jgi:cytochrome c-type biogenesis protein CcmH/NrfG